MRICLKELSRFLDVGGRIFYNDNIHDSKRFYGGFGLTVKKMARKQKVVTKAPSARRRSNNKRVSRKPYPPWIMPLVIGGCTLIAGIAIGWGYGSISSKRSATPSQQVVQVQTTAPVSRRASQQSTPSPLPPERRSNHRPTPPKPTLSSTPSTATGPSVPAIKSEPVIEVVPSPATQTLPPSTPTARVSSAAVAAASGAVSPPVAAFEPQSSSDEMQLAAITTPPSYPPVVRDADPAWIRYAVPSPTIIPGQPIIAIVIDDMGVDKKRTQRMIALPGPLTASFLPYADNLSTMTASARTRGHELLVHVPMEPLKMRGNNPGPQVLMVGQSAETIRNRLKYNLSRFDSFVGINNHMGSRFTTDEAGMAVVAEELRVRGLMFLDSVTSGKTVAARVTRQAGVPTVSRTIFLDNVNETSAVLEQLTKLEASARKSGHAIAIGHPRDGTITALARWLPTLKQKGIVLVPLSTIARRQKEQPR